MFRFIIFLCAFLVFVRCDQNDDKNAKKMAEEIMIGLMLDSMSGIATQYFENFLSCVFVPMRGSRFDVDDIYEYINRDGMTTVAVFGPKVTSNRKFFANLLASTAFKDMLSQDEHKMKHCIANKMKLCQTIVIDKESLKSYYDKELPEFT